MSEQLNNPESVDYGGSSNPWEEAMANVPEFGENESPETNTPDALGDDAIEPPTSPDAYEASSDVVEVDPSNQLERNRDRFNLTTKRLAYIASIYPDINAAPQSVQHEVSLLGRKRGRLSGENTGIQVMGVTEAKDGAIVSGWKLQEYNEDIDKQTQLRVENQQQNYLEENGEENVELPTIDLGAFQKRVANMSSDYSELGALDQEITQADRFADLDTHKKLLELKREATKAWSERLKADEQAELERLEQNLAEIEAKIQQASESYRKLNIFQKAWKKFTSTDERGTLEQEHTRARQALDDFRQR